MTPPKGPATFSSDGRFAHCSPPAMTPLIMSVCCSCGEYIAASEDERLLTFVEQFHECPGYLLDPSYRQAA